MLVNASFPADSRQSHRRFSLLIGLCVIALSLYQAKALIAIYSNQGFEVDRTMAPAVLTTMAVDLVNGVFYRPLVGPDGYGGTRYMPLYFILQAGLMKLGFSPMTASWSLSVLSLIALLSSVYFILHIMRVKRPLIWAGTLYVLLSATTQFVFSSMRLDALAVAFNLLGIGLSLHLLNIPRPNAVQIGAMILCFGLAFITKVSMIHGAITVILFYALNNRRRLALLTGVSLTALIAIAIMVFQFASNREFMTSFMTTGLANGGLIDLIKAPFIWYKLCLHSPGSLLTILLAWAVLLSGLVSPKRDLLSLFLWVTSIIVLLLFGSPGTSHNHILDLYIAAVIYLVVRIDKGEIQPKPALAYLTIAAVISSGLQINDLSDKANYYRNTTKLAEVKRLLTAHQVLTPLPGSGPILADNPWLPLLLEERPYVLDQFMLGIVNQRNPTNLERFRNQIRKQFFRAVVIENPQVHLDDPKRAEPLMGCDLTQELLQQYQIAGHTGLGIVLVRKATLQNTSLISSASPDGP